MCYICYASSDLFAEPTGISIISLLENNKHANIGGFFVLDYGITEQNKKRLSDICNRYNQKVQFIRSKEIIENKRDEMQMQDFEGSMATYSRAFIDLIIPDYVDDLLYVDSDTVVVGDISEILNFDIGNHVFAAAIGINQYHYQNEPQNDELNLLTNNSVYYACGVVRYSLKNWRANKCHDMIVEACHKLARFPYADQTVINNAIPEHLITAIPQKYNSWLHELPVCLEEKELKRGGFLNHNQILDARQHPTIHHYKGLYYRPWYENSISRANDEYYKYKALSPWKDVPLKPMPFPNGNNSFLQVKMLKMLGKEQGISFYPAYLLYDFYRRFVKRFYLARGEKL